MKLYGIAILNLVILMLVPIAFAQDSVNVPLPNIPPGQQVIVTYDVQVNEQLPPGLLTIINQGQVIDANGNFVLTNDPTISGVNNPTQVRVGFTLPVIELPATGEAPLWRGALIALLAGFIAVGVTGGVMRRWQAIEI